MAFHRSSDYAFFGVSALIFVVSAAITIAWCSSMSDEHARPARRAGLAEAHEMRGHGSMSASGAGAASAGQPSHRSRSEGWMRMPEPTWPVSAASFLGMWVVMMVAMMLPSLAPMLAGYRTAVGIADERRLGVLTALVGVAYFVVWTGFGLAAYPLGAALTTIEMRQPMLARAVPAVIAVVVLFAGVLQFTTWKARQLACCREAATREGWLPADVATAWRHGVRLGLRCAPCCANLMVILLVMGVMDLRAMAFVTAAITLERLAPTGERAARAIGSVAVAAGVILIARAL